VAAIALALAASLSWGTGDFLGGLASRRSSTATVVALSMAAGMVLIAAVVVISRDELPGRDNLLAAVGAGAAGALGLAGLYRGLAVGAMGVVAPISALAAALPFTIGLLEGERPGSLQVAGVVVALAGVVLVAREPGGATGSARAAGVGLALTAACGFGLYFVLLDAASDESVPWAVLVARATAALLALGAVAVLRAPLRVPRALVPMVLGVGAFDVAANVLFGLASARGLVSVVSVLSALYPVVTVGLAWVVLRERTSAGQRLGAAAALAGAALIAAG
jgi:drug/metabolite transporter (DMT)-like permease